MYMVLFKLKVLQKFYAKVFKSSPSYSPILPFLKLIVTVKLTYLVGVMFTWT